MSEQGWIGFVDPYERAFSIDVAVGWLVFGGMIRFDPIHPTIYLRADSPDRRTRAVRLRGRKPAAPFQIFRRICFPKI